MIVLNITLIFPGRDKISQWLLNCIHQVERRRRAKKQTMSESVVNCVFTLLYFFCICCSLKTHSETERTEQRIINFNIFYAPLIFWFYYSFGYIIFRYYILMMMMFVGNNNFKSVHTAYCPRLTSFPKLIKRDGPSWFRITRSYLHRKQ